MFDDTVYFIPCRSQSESDFISELLNSEEAHSYLESMIFWNDKRPITIDVLKRLSIAKLAILLERNEEYVHFTALYDKKVSVKSSQQALVFA